MLTLMAWLLFRSGTHVGSFIDFNSSLDISCCPPNIPGFLLLNNKKSSKYKISIDARVTGDTMSFSHKKLTRELGLVL